MTKPDFSPTPSSVTSSFGMPLPTEENQRERLALIDDLKLFLATAADHWEDHSSPLKRFSLPTGESISCVLWNDLYFVTGTDIVRSLTFRFHAFGRPITNAKKFEEGIFSDLRNLKPGSDARLEEPKSELLDMLYKNNCIRTQKKQKVFYWYSVPHDRLFLDALERDLKREKMGLEPTTKAVAEPASSTSLDTTQELFDQLRKSMSISAAASAQVYEEEATHQFTPKGSASTSVLPAEIKANKMRRPVTTTSGLQNRRSRVNSVPADFGQDPQLHQQLLVQQQKHQRQHFRQNHPTYFPSSTTSTSSLSSSSSLSHDDAPPYPDCNKLSPHDPLVEGVHHLDITTSNLHARAAPPRSTLANGVLPSKSMDSNTLKKTKTIFGSLSLFDGSPTYKQRRRRATSVSSGPAPSSVGGPDRVRRHANGSHSRTPSISNGSVSNSSSSTSISSLNHAPTSRLAMAAMASAYKQTSYHPHHHPHQRPASMCSPHAHHLCRGSLQQPVDDYLSPQTWFMEDRPLLSSTSTQLTHSGASLFSPTPPKLNSAAVSPLNDPASLSFGHPPHSAPSAMDPFMVRVCTSPHYATMDDHAHHLSPHSSHSTSVTMTSLHSPAEDMDDIQSTMPPPINTSPSSAMHTSPDFMLMLSPQDDFSNSSTSSPSSMMHYGYDMMPHPAALDQISASVLLSSFKPDYHVAPPTSHQDFHPADLSMYNQMPSYCMNYQEYPPLTTNDVAMVFH
ncbi:STE-domain-containing protein [Hesseltinella vesiculosa]|uniref:STE-domain-containing protein n=1 Tax=Hesseltinella vesiculosa TaxID=101127 RepID=A0A1X2GAF8_9FUNG|nr:STE-domain-containing protein [Hesseltinella vesiculosa]